MRNLLWYLIAGTRGGETRGKILMLIKNNPANANKIAELLKLDYKTVRHHLAILEKNNLLNIVEKGNYGAVYFLSEIMEKDFTLFQEIWEQFGKK